MSLPRRAYCPPRVLVDVRSVTPSCVVDPEPTTNRPPALKVYCIIILAEVKPLVQRQVPRRVALNASPSSDIQPRGRSERNSFTNDASSNVQSGVPRPQMTCTRPVPAGRTIAIADALWLDAEGPC